MVVTVGEGEAGEGTGGEGFAEEIAGVAVNQRRRGILACGDLVLAAATVAIVTRENVRKCGTDSFMTRLRQ